MTINAGQPGPTIPIPHFLTTDEVAQMCRTSPATVRYWRHLGDGPQGFKLGRRVLYNAAEVHRWLAERQRQQSPSAV